jgi:3-oxo-5-alpha-steroid 4-dehydrogenase 1
VSRPRSNAPNFSKARATTTTTTATTEMAAILSLFGPAPADPREVIYELSYAMIFFGLSAFVALTFVTVAPYGKYAERASALYGPPINGKVAWILQECPSFLVPAYYLYKASVWGGSAAGQEVAAELATFTPRSVLAGLFLMHYANRSFIYPLRIQGGKPTPLVVALMALVFCLCNGCVEGGNRGERR